MGTASAMLGVVTDRNLPWRWRFSARCGNERAPVHSGGCHLRGWTSGIIGPSWNPSGISGEGTGTANRNSHMRTVRTVAELRRAVADARAAGGLDRARADHGLAARGPPEPRAPGRRRLRVRGREPVREPVAVRPRRGLRALSARRGARCRPGARTPAPTCCSPPRPARSIPTASPRPSAVAGLTDVLCGAPGSRGASHFDGVATVVDEAAQHVRARTSPTSARRTTSSRS